VTTTEPPQLPAWSELSDLDKGCALMFLHKRDWEGEPYAIENYPARYCDHPALLALSPRDACRHAMSVEDDAELAGALRGGEHGRLYDLALEADRARWQRENASASDSAQRKESS
jgi:hypothetical protein